ncbi:MAG: hypothetical protein QXU18_10920 [Thermoplasmatales archaeon]
MNKEPKNGRIQAFRDIITDLDNWVNSALEDLNVYRHIHLEPKISKLTGVEFIQRALEKGVKISSYLFRLLLIFSDSNYPHPFSNLISKNEVKGSLNEEFIQLISQLLASAYSLREPYLMRHTPSTTLIKEFQKSLPQTEYIELSRSREKEVIDALIQINIVSKGDAEVYLNYSKIMRNYQKELLALSANKSESFNDVISKVTKLKELRPTDAFGFLVYSVIILRLVHTTLGRMALFTPMKVFEDDIWEIDSIFSEFHNELTTSKMSSALFRNLNGIMRSLFTISAYFPLCHYLGVNYTKLKYPQTSKDLKRKDKTFDISAIIESDTFFISVSNDLKNALTDILSCSQFFSNYVFGEDAQE